MQPSASDDGVNDARTVRLYYWVIVCEVVAVTALWALGRIFS